MEGRRRSRLQSSPTAGSCQSQGNNNDNAKSSKRPRNRVQVYPRNGYFLMPLGLGQTPRTNVRCSVTACAAVSACGPPSARTVILRVFCGAALGLLRLGPSFARRMSGCCELPLCVW
jgi:hypothetical protein